MVAGIAMAIAVPQAAVAAPDFQAPFVCGQSWTYLHHGAEVRQALDFVRDDGGTTYRSPVLASAPGTATRHWQSGGAGNYIVIDHGGGWKTYYFHLDEFSVPDNTFVARGTQVGTTGSTGNSTGPHIHYEQLHDGAGQVIRINGETLAPYPTEYREKSIVSDNACGPMYFMTWGRGVRVREDASAASAVIGALPSPTYVKVVCQKQGDRIDADGYSSDWWSKLEYPAGYMTSIYIDHDAAKLPGIPMC